MNVLMPESVGSVLRCIAFANFARESKPLLKRKGAIVYRKEGLGLKSLLDEQNRG